jgi:cytochrome P450
MAITGGEPNLIRSLVSTDDLEHKQLRAITFPTVTPAAIRKLEGKIREIAREFVDRMLATGGECDFVKDIALLYPLRVIMTVLGIPPEDEPFMLKVTQELFGSADPDMNRAGKQLSPADRVAMLKQSMDDLERYFSDLTKRLRAQPEENLNSLIANAKIDGEYLNHRQLMGYYIIAATAGHDTTSNTVAASFAVLAQQPEVFARLKADPTLMPGFIEESIRWATPVKAFMRTAVSDIEIAGQSVKTGDWVLLSYHSANRDEELFPEPFKFDIDRKPNKHIAFGSGPHVCLGQHLARMEMRILWEELLPRLKSAELAGKLEMTVSNFVCGPKKLPIRFQPA